MFIVVDAPKSRTPVGVPCGQKPGCRVHSPGEHSTPSGVQQTCVPVAINMATLSGCEKLRLMPRACPVASHVRNYLRLMPRACPVEVHAGHSEKFFNP